MDPSNATAWRALRKDAEKAGDVARVGYCLEQRAMHTEVPRVRAQLFVEVALHKRSMKDEGLALVAFERAVTADPTNEVAAAAVLPSFVVAKRWAEAEPLCELLVNAATRDDDADRVFELLRSATRIAIGLRNDDRAVQTALAAYEARPQASIARDELLLEIRCILHAQRAGARERRGAASTRSPSSSRCRSTCARAARGHLSGLHGEDPTALRRVQLARVLVDPGRRAARRFPRASSTSMQKKSDWDKACATKVRLARATPDPAEKCALLIDAGDLWVRHNKNLVLAVRAYEEGRVDPSERRAPCRHRSAGSFSSTS